jgi:NTP pyrophosphatase (non-canonical NTP hydrolase)
MACRTEKRLLDYKKFVMSVASAGNKSKQEQIAQGCIGICTEAGELLDNMKKNMFQEREFDVVNAKEEAGDLLFYLTEMLTAIDSDILEVMEINTRKLQQRYKGGRFNKDLSINRDTAAERKIMEGHPKDCKKSCCNFRSDDIDEAAATGGTIVSPKTCKKCMLMDNGCVGSRGYLTCTRFKEKSVNEIKHVLFQHRGEGWRKNLAGTVASAKSLNVPVAVESESLLVLIKREHPNIHVVLI